jgi:hypothetical protein
VTVIVVLGLMAGGLRAPRVTFAATAAAAVAAGAASAAFILELQVEPALTRHDATGRDWIDRAVPGDRSVALVPGGPDGAAPWWEAELWNTDVDRVLRVDHGPTFSPFPATGARIDFEAGVLRGRQPSGYLVVSERETRFRLAGERRLARENGLGLVRVARPYRLAWATRGLTPDGWTRPRRLAVIRAYGHGRTTRRAVTVTLAAAARPARPVGFALRAGDDVLYGQVEPGGARAPVEMPVCVPGPGYADVWLTSDARSRTADGRPVGLHVERIAVREAGPCNAS